MAEEWLGFRGWPSAFVARAPVDARRGLPQSLVCSERMGLNVTDVGGPRSLVEQVKRVFCESSGAMVPKDKAVKRFLVRNIVESAAIRDLQESCVYDCE